MNWHLFSAFVLIAALLYLTPGPIVTLVVATGASRGARAALLTVAGACAGNAVLQGMIALGLSWVLQMSVEVFDYVRWIGAAYLVWLGIVAWRSSSKPAELAQPRGHVYARRGFFVAVTNPKTIAFFTAFLPQFIDPTLPVERQLLVIFVTSILLGGIFDCGWAYAAALGRAWFMKSSRGQLLNRISGLVLIGGGIWLSLTRRPA